MKTRFLSLILRCIGLATLRRRKQTPSLPDVDPRSDRFRCEVRESSFLQPAIRAKYVSPVFDGDDARRTLRLFTRLLIGMVMWVEAAVTFAQVAQVTKPSVAIEPISAPGDEPLPRPKALIPPQLGEPSGRPTEITPGEFSTVPGNWITMGPGPISGGQVEGMTDKFVCGAIHAVITHPTDVNTVYVGAVNGGVWKTTNATAANPTWVSTTASLASLSIGALAFDALDATSNTVWAGNGRFSSYAQVGGSRSALLKTADGGANWQAVDGGGVLIGKNISGLVVRGNTILASVNTADSAGNSQRGVWRSTDGGTTFTQMAVGNGSTTGLPEGVAYDLVSSPTAPNTVYTCIALTTTTSARGIFKSTDLGATWSRVSTALIENFITTSSSNIELAVGNSDNVFVGILESGATVAIFRSPDGGANWTRMDIPTMPVATATTFTVTSATNASPIVITTSASHGLSTNNYVEIAGVTGNAAANGIHQITVLTTTTFSLDFSTGNGAYAGAGTARRVVTPNPRGAKGPDAKTGTPDEISGGQGNIHFSIFADPANPNIVYLGGDRQDTPFTNFIGANDYSGNLWRGDASLAPNGLSPSSQWKHLTHSNAVAAIPGGGTTNNSSPHADSRDMAIDAAGNLIEVDDGGIYRRTNPQSNAGAWTSMAGNLQVAEIHSVAYDTVSNIVITGNQDNGTSEQTASGSNSYRAVSTGDGGDVAVSVNPSNANQSIRYSSFQNLGAFRRRIISNTNTVVSQTFPALSPLGGAPAISGQFTTPVAVNSVNANRLIIGASNGVYESTDQGTTVSRVSTLSPNDGLSGGRTMIYGGRMSGANNEEVIYFADSSAIYRRTTAGGALVAVGGYAGSTVRGIITDPEDHDHLIAIDNNQVFRSTDGGATFADITGDIPTAARDFRSLEFIESVTGGAIVVGTLRGVYAARIPAVTDWAPVGSDLPNAYVWDMDYDSADNVLVVSTMGRGVWRFDNARDIATETLAGAEISVQQPVGTNLTDTVGTQNFGAVPLGGNSVLTFRIINIGTADLTGLNITKDGTHNAEFTVGALGSTTLAPSASTNFTVTFSPSALGVRTAAIHIFSNDADENPFDINLSGGSPEIGVEQPVGTSVTDGVSNRDFGSLAVGGNAVLTFTVRNTGTSDLTGLSISKDGANSGDFTVGLPGATTLAAGASTTFTVAFSPSAIGARAAAIHIASNDSDENPFDIALSGTGQVPLQNIGPDAFGYSGTNNVAYSFTDISGTGTAILDGVDDAATSVPIGFSFPFYGTNRTDVFISSNGLLTFGSGNTVFTNVSLLAASVGQPAIAVMWDDWVTSGSGTDKVFHATTGSVGNRVFTVQWNVTPIGGGGEAVFQCLLFEATGHIRFNFSDVQTGQTGNGASNGASATIGIQDTGGNSNGRALQWSFNTASVAEGTSILFTPQASVSILSLNRANPNPTNLATVNWTLSFSAAATGVSAGNFSLSGTAASGATVGTPTTADGGLNWNVPVSTGTSSGSLTLTLANSTGLSPTVSNALPFDGASYIIDKTAPTLTLPAPITVTATSPAGAVVNYTAGASDPGGSGVASASFVPISGSTFPIGITTVNATATDNAGNVANGNFTVTVDPYPGPTGGTFTFNPSTNIHQGDAVTLTAAGWTDPDLPLTYQFFLGASPLNTPSGSPNLVISAPAPGSYTLKVRVTDSAGSFTDATQPLTVVPFNSIESWRLTFFGDYTNVGNRADNADFDLDGRLNLEEFAFGTDPTSGSSGPPALVFNGTYAIGSLGSTGQPITRFEAIANGVDLRMLFCRRVDHAAAGLTYIPEFSSDMTTYVPGGPAPVVLATDGTIQIVSVPYPPFVGGKKARFSRIRIVISP